MADQIQSPEIELEDGGSKGRYFLRSPAGDEAEMTFTKIGKTIIPLCPFAAAQFGRHPEWQDVLKK